MSGQPDTQESEAFPASETDGLLRACLVAAMGGVAIGLIGGAFRWLLAKAEDYRIEWTEWAATLGWVGILIPLGLAVFAAAFARWLVRYSPLAGGSGVQHVEAVNRGESEPVSPLLIPVKFFGGLAAIGGGLALGREGPTIQMGATIGAALAKRLRLVISAMRDLQSAMGGAGLAVAFNAPVGGALFVFEEVTKSLRLRLTMVTILATAMAVATSRWMLGSSPDFSIPVLHAGDFPVYPIIFLFGCLVGALGVLYNRTTILGLDLVASARKLPVEVRAGIIGLLVGLIGWFAPAWIGGGDNLTESILQGSFPVSALLLLIIVRWLVGPASYAAGTPGGLFSPLLLLGAALGAGFAALGNLVLPETLLLSPPIFAIVGMTAFFTGIVRAPLTGMVLIAEMTGNSGLMVPLLLGSFGAMLSATLLRGEPIYDTLRRRLPAVVK